MLGTFVTVSLASVECDVECIVDEVRSPGINCDHAQPNA